jgi:protein TonB
MFENLIESKKKKTRSAGTLLLSFILHGALIAAGLYFTHGIVAADVKATVEEIEFTKAPEKPPPPKTEQAPPPPDVVAAPPPPKGFQILTAPIKIPDVLPDIDLTKAVTKVEDFTAKGVAGGTATGVVGGTPQSINTDQPLFDFQVEQQVRAVPGQSAPDYPGVLRQSNVEGNVTAQFVVDTLGKADMGTFKEINSSHPLFTDAVRKRLPTMRFIPAEVGGRKVKQLVQMPFIFTLSMQLPE